MQTKGNLKNKILVNIIVAVVYFSMAALTLSGPDGLATSSSSNPLSICPVTSIEIAAAILLGPHISPGITLAALAASIIKGFNLPSAVLVSIAHGLGTFLSAIVIKRWIRKSNPFQEIGNFFHYLVVIVLVISCGISAMRAVSICLNLESFQSFTMLFKNLWINAINGLLIITPFIVVWADRSIAKTKRPMLHTTAIAIFLILGLIVWAISGSQQVFSESSPFLFEFIIIPAVISITALFGLRGAVSASLLFSIFSIVSPMLGIQVFGTSNSSYNTLFLQSYQAVAASTGLLAAAALSERNKALQETRQAHATQQAFLNNTSVWLSMADANHKITSWSKGAEKISGYTFEEASSSEIFWQQFHTFQPQYEPLLENMHRQMRENSLLENYELPIQTKNGEKRLISWNVNSLRTKDDKNLGTIVIGTDLTAQRKAENSLLQERDLAEAIVNAAMVISGTLELEDIIQRILSQAMEVIPCDGVNILLIQEDSAQVTYQYGYQNLDDPDSMSGTQFSSEEIQKIIAKGESSNRDLIADTWQDPRWITTPTTQWIRSYISAPIKLRGEVLGLLNLDSSKPNNFNYAHARTLQTLGALLSNTLENAQRFDDIQLHADELEKRVNERTAELQSTNQELQQALRSKDDFLTNMSHEFRTPLTAILGMSEMLESQVRGPLNEVQSHYTQTIIESGQHLLALINDILDLARIESEKLTLYVDSISVNDVCKSCLSMIGEAAQKKGLQIEYSPDQPDASLQADPLRLKQILINLLSNAVKFTPENGSIGLEVCRDLSAQSIQFTVWDTGIGIKPEDAKKLFQPFVQLDGSLSRSFEGTGLGLTLVAKLTEMHGGSVKLESKGIPGKGTKMTISLPLYQEKGLPALPTFPISADVLLIENHFPSIQQIHRALNATGLTVRIAKCGEEAADLDRNGYPDLVILNMQTCKTNGWQIPKKIHAWFSPCRPPIIILTSISLPGDEERAIAAGASAYLSKPVNMTHLTNLASSLIARGKTNK